MSAAAPALESGVCSESLVSATGCSVIVSEVRASAAAIETAKDVQVAIRVVGWENMRTASQSATSGKAGGLR